MQNRVAKGEGGEAASQEAEDEEEMWAKLQFGLDFQMYFLSYEISLSCKIMPSSLLKGRSETKTGCLN